MSATLTVTCEACGVTEQAEHDQRPVVVVGPGNFLASVMPDEWVYIYGSNGLYMTHETRPCDPIILCPAYLCPECFAKAMAAIKLTVERPFLPWLNIDADAKQKD